MLNSESEDLNWELTTGPVYPIIFVFAIMSNREGKRFSNFTTKNDIKNRLCTTMRNTTSKHIF